jgi:glutamate-1-semialdehyde 2,1-aminomutase
MKIVIFVQARLGSSRLPNKVLLPLGDKTVLDHVVERCKKAQFINDVIVCTTTCYTDNDLVDHCTNNNIKYFRGNENNVLDRFYQASRLVDADIIIRCTCDCPLIDYTIIDEMLTTFIVQKLKYYNMKYGNGSCAFPDGFDVEIFTNDILKETWQNATEQYDKEHVTTYMKRNFLTEQYEININKNTYPLIDFDNLHLSLDTNDDYVILQRIFLFFQNKNFLLNDILEFLNNVEPSYFNFYSQKKLEKGQDLYKIAKTIIPGGNQFLSKRPEMYLPDLWPAYYQKAKGIEVITLDGVKMQDFCYMGIGACILGYNNEYVNMEVHKAVERGNATTLNCPSEVKLAQTLCKLHPWADMARFTRTSGEACCVAVRIARAYNKGKRDKVAFCGYHGWHDWYLSANLNEASALNNHLITGLSTDGVPNALKNTAFPFKYNCFDELKSILDIHPDVGTIIMEPSRSESPKDDFLKKVRALATERNIILIFDEVSSGFRINTGGIHLTFGINPDIAIFGKAIGNGYPIAAVIGTRQIMESAQNTFMSSTNWSEDIGFCAALATIEQYEKHNIGNYLTNLGKYFQKELERIALETCIKITISGLPSMTTFIFNYPESNLIRTLYTQFMLDRNILAKNALYLSYSHNKENIDFYLKNIKEVFTEIVKHINTQTPLRMLLKSDEAHQGFSRLA